MTGDAAPLLLISMPQMADPNFARSVVLLCDYTDQGAFGVVVNRPMAEPASDVIRTQPPVVIHPAIHLYLGGPVEPQRTWILMTDGQGPEEDQREVCPGVLLSASPALALRLLQSAPTPNVRVIVGYAGWGAGQLDKELAASAWLTIDVDPGLIFGVAPEQMWEAAIRRLGTEPAALQMSSGVH